jgi:rRNA-processing protein EBP2
MAKSKLKAALDAHKGVDYKQVKEKKQQKTAEKHKRAKRSGKRKATTGEGEPKIGTSADASEDDEEGGVLIDEKAVGTAIAADEEKKLQAELKALLGNKKKLMEIDSGSEVDEDADEWESAAEDLDGEEEDEDENAEDSSDEESQDVRFVTPC